MISVKVMSQEILGTRFLLKKQGDDLAILQFRTKSEIYNVPSIGIKPSVGTEVAAAGFPFTEGDSRVDSLTLTTGKVALILDKVLQGEQLHTLDWEINRKHKPIYDERSIY
ncbi:MAG: hypothetical protein AAGG00_15695 [Cyanobacteria bacterium P01_H01_bin.150]